MILLTMVLIALILALVFILTGGVGLLLAFGDVIIFGLIVYGLVKLFTRKKKS